MQELWFLRFACRLMLIDIHIKFCQDILNSFQVALFANLLDILRTNYIKQPLSQKIEE